MYQRLWGCVFFATGVLAGCGPDDGDSGGHGGASSGGANNLGGAQATGGAANGGTANGGAKTTGGAANGGTANGGAKTMGGAASGGAQATGGAANGGTSAKGGSSSSGGVPSTEGLPFVGSCKTSDHCTDEWDSTFGSAFLSQACTSQSGTWSTTHCDATPWKKKCTQAVFGGVYVQYLLADGVCVAGVEEPL